MQGLSSFPRNNLSANQVKWLLAGSPGIEISYGADILDEYLNYVADLTPYMTEGSTISFNSTATICGTCSLLIDSDAPLNILTQRVRPWMVLTDPDSGLAGKFNLGVYVLTSPEIDLSVTPAILTYGGYDLSYLLSQPIGDSVFFAAGSDPVSACITLIGDAITTNPTIISTSTTKTLAVDTSYPFDQSNTYAYLDVINDLLATCGYYPLYMDWNGAFQLQPYVAPVTLTPEYVFDLTDSANNIVAAARKSDLNVFGIPNWWRFVMNGLNASPVEGTNQYTFTDTDPNRPTSYPNRGYYVKSIHWVNAADYASLVLLATAQINADRSPAETLTQTLAPFPLLWHYDQAVIVDPNMSGSQFRRVQSTQWQLSLDGTSDMSVTWEVVAY